MKRFKQMAAMLLFALLTAGFTSSAMASSGSGGPWDFGIPGHYFFCKLQPPDSLQFEPPPGEFCWH